MRAPSCPALGLGPLAGGLGAFLGRSLAGFLGRASGICCHSSGSRSMTVTSPAAAAPTLAAAASANRALAHRRNHGTSSAKPSRSVINPGKTRRIPPRMAAEAGRLQVHRPQTILGERGADAIEVAAPGPPQQNHARDRGGEEQNDRPQPADHQRRPGSQVPISAAGSITRPIKAHLTKDIGSDSCLDLVGATIWIVYGPRRCDDLRRRFTLDQSGQRA